MIAFDGNAKTITLSVATSFTALEIYNAAKLWEDDELTMQYLSPMDAVGKASLGNSVYTDSIFKLLTGWKLIPSGYSQGTILTVQGTLITDDGSSRVLAATTGSEVNWIFQSTTAATIVAIGSGLSTEQDSKLGEIASKVAFIPEKTLASKSDISALL